MSLTIQFLISFIRSQIQGFDQRLETFRKNIPKYPSKNAFCLEILEVCKKQAKAENSQIELEEGQHTKKEHANNVLKCCARIASK